MSSEDWQAGKRQELLNRLEHCVDCWDVIVVGGGITGAGIAREAVRKGLKILLVERQDFAWGTSSRSSKMVHGGLRYIAAGDIKTTLHSVREREKLLAEAPGLVDPLGFMMSHYKKQFPGPKVFNGLLSVYDSFAGKKYRKRHSISETEYLTPLINKQNLTGSTQFADAITDDSRLVMRVLREAQNEGADIVNYVSAKTLLRNDEAVSGCILEDRETGRQFTANAKVVINATGAWVDELRDKSDQGNTVRPARGSHIVLPAWRLPVAQSYTVVHPENKRPVFIFPWEGRTVIGTTDLDQKTLGDQEISISEAEFNYLLKVPEFLFPSIKLSEKDVISTWAGVRPLISSGKLDPSREKRTHSIWDDKGLVSVSGGKLTTFRLIALDVLNKAGKYLNGPQFEDSGERIFTEASSSTSLLNNSLPDYLVRRLQGHYGPDLKSMLELAEESDLECVPGTRTLWLELRWAAAQEAVLHLDDLLLRRTRIGLLVKDGGLIFENRIKEICCRNAGWSQAKWLEEKGRYQTIWQTYYSLPAGKSRKQTEQ
ncbi:FAD-dependent oxidoreductase [Endozoicomonas sp. OPT23]|uniref:glycerol-3-phosphate dehydrogenase/oxidase n=1 Tax=Endozoicomonas sp. OPT23 TaxID=2072845 RepID=UPI00129BFB69|nr:glycerol-3-phosphate dehydrogenase/oxidase [Endozoicomonas sp. OPT23]MRI32836.1 FAD-dependent oxidoreductase [Endozoicomonas sp. OPT23]